MALIRNTDTNRVDAAGAALSLDPTNPVHLMYGGAGLVGAGTVVTSLGVTTIAAPGVVLVPTLLAAGLTGGAVYMQHRNANAALDTPAPAADAIPAAA